MKKKLRSSKKPTRRKHDPFFRYIYAVPENTPILLMSTCSSETTDGRTLLAASFKKGIPPKIKEDDEKGFWIHIPSIHIEELNVTHLLIGITIWLLVTIIFTLLKRKGNRNGSQKREGNK